MSPRPGENEARSELSLFYSLCVSHSHGHTYTHTPTHSPSLASVTSLMFCDDCECLDGNVRTTDIFILAAWISLNLSNIISLSRVRNKFQVIFLTDGCLCIIKAISELKV